MDRKLLDAKNAIFKMIAQFHHPTMFDDGELYIFNYCESALVFLTNKNRVLRGNYE